MLCCYAQMTRRRPREKASWEYPSERSLYTGDQSDVPWLWIVLAIKQKSEERKIGTVIKVSGLGHLIQKSVLINKWHVFRILWSNTWLGEAFSALNSYTGFLQGSELPIIEMLLDILREDPFVLPSELSHRGKYTLISLATFGNCHNLHKDSL